MSYKSFEELEVWKQGCRLAVRVYEMLKECRDFGLKDQPRNFGHRFTSPVKLVS